MSETNNYPQHDNSFQSIKMLTSATCLNELITNSTLKNIKIHEGETIFIDEKPKTIEKNPKSVDRVNQINWYGYMVIQNTSNLSLMDEYSYEQLCSMFVVCCNLPIHNKTGTLKTKPIRKFAAFNSYSHFLSYINVAPRENWSFFEVIMADCKQKLYFDIDIAKNKIPVNENLKDFSGRLLNYLLAAIELTLLEHEIKVNIEKDIMIFSSNADHKYSYHVILNNYYIHNNKLNASLSSEIKKKMPEEYANFVDDAVYKGKQQLRCYKSRKLGTTRVKELVASYYYNEKLITQDDSNFENTFKLSCITYTEHCQLIPVCIQSDNSILTINTDVATLTQVDIDEIKKLAPPVLFKIFKMTNVKGKLITLARISKAECSLCNRVHEHEGAYLYVDQRALVHLHCRRQPDQSKILFICKLSRNEEIDSIYDKVLAKYAAKYA